MTSPRPKSNVTVTIPDLSGPLAQATEEYNKCNLADGGTPIASLEAQQVGYVQTEHGLFALCREGVGASEPITADKPLEVDIYTPNSGYPVGSIRLNDTELIMLPTKSEEPLEQFIRSFGRRLESNYSIWFRHFQKNKPMAIEAHG